MIVRLLHRLQIVVILLLSSRGKFVLSLDGVAGCVFANHVVKRAQHRVLLPIRPWVDVHYPAFPWQP